MRIAIIADIHEDFALLERATQALAAQGYDLLAVLGDITGYSPLFHAHAPDANACLDLIRERAQVVLPGNHDLFTARRLPSYHGQQGMPPSWYSLPPDEQLRIGQNRLWLYEHEVPPALSDLNRQYLEGLPEWAVVDADGTRILLSHFLFPDYLGVGRWFPSHVDELQPHLQMMRTLDCPLAFAGHSHPEGITLLSPAGWSAPRLEPVAVPSTPQIALCPATVRSSKPSAGMVFDSRTALLAPVVLAPPRCG